MLSPTQRVRATANLLRLGTVEAHIGEDVYIVWDEDTQATKLRPDEIEPISAEDEVEAKAGAKRFLAAILGRK